MMIQLHVQTTHWACQLYPSRDLSLSLGAKSESGEKREKSPIVCEVTEKPETSQAIRSKTTTLSLRENKEVFV